MDASVRDEYLTTEVLTATPQKLQLMLIDAAIRSAELARGRWNADDPGAVCEALVHAQDCMGQLLAGLNHEGGSAVVPKLAALYVFVLRRLVDANLHRDPKKLDEALKILRMERETWRQVCDRAGAARQEAPAGAEYVRSGAPSPARSPRPLPPAALPATDDLPAGGFSLEV